MCTMPEAASYVAAALPTIWRLLARRRYDLVHAHFIFPSGLLAGIVHSARGLPYVITAHGSDVPGHNPHRFSVAHRMLSPLWHALARGASRVVCPSERLQALVTQHNHEVQTTVIPNGIDLQPSRPTNGAKQSRILIVARMIEGKGVQHVLTAFNGYSKRVELHIVGDGPYLPALQEIARAHGVQATFWGWLDNQSPELRHLYQTSSIFVLPSEAENFPIVLLEAMAAGLAIITSEGTGCAEVVGEAALLVPPGDPRAIKDALHRLLSDPGLCNRLTEAGRQRVEDHFSWKTIAGRYADIYRTPQPATRGTGA